MLRSRTLGGIGEGFRGGGLGFHFWECERGRDLDLEEKSLLRLAWKWMCSGDLSQTRTA